MKNSNSRLPDGFLLGCALLALIFAMVAAMSYGSVVAPAQQWADTHGTYKVTFIRPLEPGLMRCDVLLPFRRTEHDVLISYWQWNDRVPNDMWWRALLLHGQVFVRGSFDKANVGTKYVAEILVQPEGYHRLVTVRELGDVGCNESKLPKRSEE